MPTYGTRQQPSRATKTRQRQLPIRSTAFRMIAAQVSGLPAAICNSLIDESDSESESEDDDSSQSPAPQINSPGLWNLQRTPAGASFGRFAPGTGLQPILPSDVDVAQSKQAWYATWIKEGHSALARSVMKHEIEGRFKGSATIQAQDTSWAGDVMTSILQSSEDCLIESVTFGNLALDRRQNMKLAAVLQRLWQKSRYMPGIYHQQLVNDNGLSPTPNELKKVTAVMRNYAYGTRHSSISNVPFDDTCAYKIDNIKHKVDLNKTKKSFRKYLWSKEDLDATHDKLKKAIKAPFLDGHVEEIRTDIKGSRGGKRVLIEKVAPRAIQETLHFCDALDQRLDKLPVTEHNKPLKHPLVEVGYSASCIERLMDHDAHVHSNYVMNLMEAVFEYLHQANGGTGEPTYRVEQLVIYLIWSPEQAEISEIGWTKLAEGYTGNGGGFSHYPAGRSNRSAHKVKSETWSYAMLVALNGSPLKFNIGKEEAKKKARSQAEFDSLLEQGRQKRKQRLEELQDNVQDLITTTEKEGNLVDESLQNELDGIKAQIRQIEQAYKIALRKGIEHTRERATVMLEGHKTAFNNTLLSAIGGLADTIEAFQMAEVSAPGSQARKD